MAGRLLETGQVALPHACMSVGARAKFVAASVHSIHNTQPHQMWLHVRDAFHIPPATLNRLQVSIAKAIDFNPYTGHAREDFVHYNTL